MFFILHTVVLAQTWFNKKIKVESHYVSHCVGDRLTRGLILCYFLWPDRIVSATNFVLQTAYSAPLQKIVGGGESCSLVLKKPSSPIQWTNTWFSCAGDQFLWFAQRIRPLAVQPCTVCRSALGSSWQGNGAGIWKQGFTSAVIFELRRREFTQDFFKRENCHPKFFLYHAH